MRHIHNGKQHLLLLSHNVVIKTHTAAFLKYKQDNLRPSELMHVIGYTLDDTTDYTSEKFHHLTPILPAAASAPEATDDSFNSDEFSTKLNVLSLHDTSPNERSLHDVLLNDEVFDVASTTAEVHDLGARSKVSTSWPEVVYTSVRPLLRPAILVPAAYVCAPTTTAPFSVTYASVVLPTSTSTSTSTSTTTSVLSTVDASDDSAPGPSTSGLAGVSYVRGGQLAPPAQSVSLPAVVAPGAPAAVPIVYENDEIDDSMTDYAPLKFRGVVFENADTWIRQFNNYCEYRDYNADKTKQLFKVLLIDSAAVWYDSLPDTVRADWTQLQGAFRTRYMPAEFLKYQHASESA